MKKVLSICMLIAAAAVASVSCTKNEAVQDNNGTIDVSVSAVSLDTKVTIGEKSGNKYPVTWDATGESVKMVELIEGAKKEYTSASYSTADGGNKACFSFSIGKTDASSYNYIFVSPASAYQNSYPETNRTYLKLPQSQTCTATSVDPAAALVFASALGLTKQATSVEADFSSLCAYGKLSIRNVPVNGTEKIQKVTIASAGKAVSGGAYYTWGDGSIEPNTGAISDNVVVSVPETTSSSLDVWFTCWPFEIEQNGKLTVSVATDETVYSREFTVPTAKAFVAGQVSEIPVNMAQATKPVDYSGTYIAMVKSSTKYYAISSTANGTRLSAVETQYDGTSTSMKVKDATLVWNVSMSGAGYTFENGGRYISWGEGNTASMSDAAYLLTLSKNAANGTFSINSAATPDRKLQFNSSSKFFAFYTSSQVGDFYLVPGSYDSTPVLTLKKDEISGVPAAGVTDAKETDVYVLDNASDSDVTVTPDGTIVTSASVLDGALTYSVSANSGAAREGSVKLKMAGKEYTVTVKQSAAGTADAVVLIIDGSQLSSTATTDDVEKTFGGVKVIFRKGAKVQSSPTTAANKFTDKAILIGKEGAYIYNSTAIPGKITKFEIYANKGASAKVSVGVNFSSSAIASYVEDANNTYTATLSSLDTVYDCSGKLPEDAKYFWYQVTNDYNSQVQFRITYIPNSK